VNVVLEEQKTSSPDAERLKHLRKQGGFFPLRPSVRVRVTGEDRLRYLNGQVSNDLRRLSAGEAMPALLLSAKGKLCADVFVWIDEESLLVEADAALGDGLLARLERYAVADDVACESVSSAPQACHLFGAASSAATGLRIRRIGIEGVDLSLPPAGLAEASADDVELLRIERGVPRWGNELSEETLPQEAGLDRNAVDFKKGCYVGQEVVSRIHSVGRVNRHLCGFIGNFNPTIAGKATLADSAGQKCGRLTSAAYHPGLRKSIALGFLQSQAAEVSFSVVDETGACFGQAERSQFPLVP
jgi:tRNA-modifying protein YgfZ